MASVFLSIASYCDPVLPFTLLRAKLNAQRPDRLHFGIVDQSPDVMDVPSPEQLAPARLTYQRIDPVYSRGPCWARALAMGLYDGEDWFFQIDSHMDFEPGWDEKLIAQALPLQEGRPGAVVSAYPNAFVFQEMRPVPRPTTDKVLAHVVKPNTAFEADHLVLGFEAHPVDTDAPVPGFHLGAGCLFAPGRFVEAFPYDPWFYFHGEEQALAARLFSHGWDIFHMAGLPIYHLYNTPDAGVPPRPLHWDAAQDSKRRESWWQLEQRSRRRLSALLSGAPLGVYSLGKVRSMADYAAFCGIDYAARTLAPQAYTPVA